MNCKLITQKNLNKKDMSNSNFSLKFLKKKMKRLNHDLDFMSDYLFRLRIKINNNARYIHE